MKNLNPTLLNDSGYVFSQHLDHEFLTRNYGQNITLAKKIFENFIKSVDTELTRLRESVAQNEMNIIASIAHKIRNNFIYTGAPTLAIILKRLEQEAKVNSKNVQQIFQEFEKESRDTLPAIKEEYLRLKSFHVDLID